jgi:hypothetical protein
MESFVLIAWTAGPGQEFKHVRPDIEDDAFLLYPPFQEANNVTIIVTLRFQVIYNQTNPRRPLE